MPDLVAHDPLQDSPDRIITESERARIVPYSRPAIKTLEDRGEFPRRIQLGPRKHGWLLSEVMAWIAEQAAKRNDRPPSPGHNEQGATT